jgi:hypothetical protein
MPARHIETGVASATNTRAAHFSASGVATSFVGAVRRRFDEK